MGYPYEKRQVPTNLHENFSYLFVVQPSGEREDAGLGIQREHVVGPIADHGVRQLGIRSQIGIRRTHLTNPGSAQRVLRHVERIRTFGKNRRVVVGVGHLKQKKIFL